ncbi:MAG: DUF2059 domain-containing protein [Spirochaetes bacterium]|nr:DUF2059 domain-containing protein [Spirochaetota bacterium]
MKNIELAICVALLLFYPSLAVTGQASADPQLVQTLLIKSGISKQMAQLPQVAQASLVQANQQSQKMSQEELVVVSSLVAEVFDTTVMIDSARDVIQANMSDGDILAVLTWLDSPLGTRLTKLEEEAASVSAYQEMQAMAEQLMTNAGRVALMKRLDSAVRATESGIAFSLNSQSATVLALTAPMPMEQRPSVEDITRMVNKNQEQVLPYIEHQVVLSFLYTYRTITDAEVERYIVFAQSESGKKYHDVVIQGLHDAVVKGLQAMWWRLMKG